MCGLGISGIYLSHFCIPEEIPEIPGVFQYLSYLIWDTETHLLGTLYIGLSGSSMDMASLLVNVKWCPQACLIEAASLKIWFQSSDHESFPVIFRILMADWWSKWWNNEHEWMIVQRGPNNISFLQNIQHLLYTLIMLEEILSIFCELKFRAIF